MVEDLMVRWAGWMHYTVVQFSYIYIILGLWWMFGNKAWPAFRDKAFQYAVGANAVLALFPFSLIGLLVYYAWKPKKKADEKKAPAAKKAATH